jgi:hypothetical protein
LTLFLNFMVDPLYEGADKRGAVWSITTEADSRSGYRQPRLETQGIRHSVTTTGIRKPSYYRANIAAQAALASLYP